MELCHARSIEAIKKLLGPITHRSLLRALDVAGGDGRLSKDFLTKQYRKTDLFDQCGTAVSKARAALRSSPNFGNVEQGTMQDYVWHFHYSAVYMVWCAGYLPDKLLVTFLKKAKSRLLLEDLRQTR